MNTPHIASPGTLSRIAGQARDILPGLALAAAVAIAALASERWIAGLFPVPAMVIALVFGIVLNGVAKRPVFRPGTVFCVKTLLRWAVALLGLRISLGDIAALGAGAALVTVAAMTVTLLSGFMFARLLGQTESYGALAGAGTAVCGASAALATSAVLPAYQGKEADVAFVVIAVNALSTLAMVLYPPLCAWLGFDGTQTGILLGATIHDVAQVAGAGYAAGEHVGNTAVVVKLFRVLLLFPVVVAVAWWFLRPKPPVAALRSSVPGFALVFVALCVLNSAVSAIPGAAPVYEPVRQIAGQLSAAGLLVAISALGLGTSPGAVASLGWRHILTVMATTAVILAVTVAGIYIVR